MGKKAVVTGASRGIGRGIARCLARDGYDVAFSYKSQEEEAVKTAEELRTFGVRAEFFQADLEASKEGERFFEKAADALGGLDLLVNNAGVTVFRSVLELTEEETQALIALDLLNYLILSKCAAVYMKERGIRGSIIQITSSRAERAYPGDCVYGGIKAAIERASRSMALDLAPYGIRVNCVAPGAVRIRTEEEIRREGRKDLENFWENLGDRIPLKRNGTPEDIGNAVVFLAGESASYITGETVRVDGGLILPGMPETESERERGWGGTCV